MPHRNYYRHRASMSGLSYPSDKAELILHQKLGPMNMIPGGAASTNASMAAESHTVGSVGAPYKAATTSGESLLPWALGAVVVGGGVYYYCFR
jgi:hypothetical protein